MRKLTIGLLILFAACLGLAAGPRRITFNRRPLSPRDAQVLAMLEARWGQRLPDGDYWYDDRCGAAGRLGGPTAAILPAGLGLGGPLPADASVAGAGRSTRVFINGRELHPVDVAGLQALVGAVAPGRYWVDAQGNAGPEGGPAVVNLYAVARQSRAGRGGGAWSSRTDMLTGRSQDNVNLASDGQTTCVTTSGKTYCTDGNN